MRAPWILALALAGAAWLTAPACGPAVIDAHYAEVVEPPPPPYDEEVPDPPGPGYVWIPGYWYWDGVTYVWQPGRWSRPPVVGHVWVPSGWIYVGGRYRFVRGYWAPPRYVRHYRYVHPVPRVIHHRPRYRAVPRRDPKPRAAPRR